MDFDLNFGRFFGPKIDVFEKFLLPDFELQLEVRSAKIVILPRENAVFYKIDILALKWALMENMKNKKEKHHFEIKLFFHIDFSWILEPTWVDFGCQVEASEHQPPRLRNKKGTTKKKHHQNISFFCHIGCYHFDGRHPDLHTKAKYRACNANHDAWRTGKEGKETNKKSGGAGHSKT